MRRAVIRTSLYEIIAAVALLVCLGLAMPADIRADDKRERDSGARAEQFERPKHERGDGSLSGSQFAEGAEAHEELSPERFLSLFRAARQRYERWDTTAELVGFPSKNGERTGPKRFKDRLTHRSNDVRSYVKVVSLTSQGKQHPEGQRSRNTWAVSPYSSRHLRYLPDVGSEGAITQTRPSLSRAPDHTVETMFDLFGWADGIDPDKAAVEALEDGQYELQATVKRNGLELSVVVDPDRGFIPVVTALGRDERFIREHFEDYHKVGDNLWFPFRVVTDFRVGESREQTNVRTHQQVRVNEPIPHEKLTLAFPEGVPVEDRIRGVASGPGVQVELGASGSGGILSVPSGDGIAQPSSESAENGGSRTFNSDLPFSAYALRGELGTTESLGHTPSRDPLQTPRYAMWYVEPRWPPGEVGLAALAEEVRQKDVPGLSLTGAYLEGAAVRHLERMPPLQLLYLSGGEVTDRVLTHVAKLENLRVLHLYHTDITDEGLANLRELEGLRILGLRHSEVSGAGLKHLGDLENLQTLDLRSVQFSAKGVASLQGLTDVRNLDLTGSSITDDGLAHLEGLQNLRQLRLSETAITDEGLKHLGELGKLEVLCLRRTALSGAGLAHLGGLENLKRLYLFRTNVTEQGVRDLKKHLPQCTILN